MLNIKLVAVSIAFLSIAFLGSQLIVENENVPIFHSPSELAFFKEMRQMDVVDSSAYFSTFRSCDGCHGYDMNQFGNVNGEGVDVNVVDDWKGTMMANSSKDPFWRAKVSHEVLVNPSHAAALENSCTSCHAPLGHYTAFFRGESPYRMADIHGDSLGLDGVSCAACHQQSPDQIGLNFSGQINLDTNRVIYGPYEDDIFEGPMDDFVGFKPLFGSHIGESELCASCHTLIVETADLSGNLTGTTLVEQATYHEWVNSSYSTGKEIISCQSCHLPQIDDPVVISNNYIALEPRTPYGLHTLVGGNSFMLELMKNNSAQLNLEATAADFDASIAATLQQLQTKTVAVNLDFKGFAMDTAKFDLEIMNKAGHKFPSGYPSRIAFVEFLVTDAQGNKLFHSGKLDADQRIENEDIDFEPHYNRINSEEQVQIYQVVNGDVNGDVSTVLERGAVTLKDNRLTPIGFSTNHMVYDTTAIVGNALNDPDFNYEISGGNAFEGSGGDILHFDISLNGYSGLLNVYAKVWYQSIPPKWVDEIFADFTPEIDTFKTMYEAADKSPVLVGEAELVNITLTATHSIPTDQISGINVFPNPSKDGIIRIDYEENLIIEQITLMALNGKRLTIWGQQETKLTLPETKGMYFLEFKTNKGIILRKVSRI